MKKFNDPVDDIKRIHVSEIQANDYNPNNVALAEMELLYISIKEDGYTQPVVISYDSEINKYIIVDGFHRYTIMKTRSDIYDRYQGMLPCVILRNKSLEDRKASTVRHNRARGKHSVQGTSGLVYQLLESGWSDKEICTKLGLQKEELLRLKHITGFSKLYAHLTLDDMSRSFEKN